MNHDQYVQNSCMFVKFVEKMFSSYTSMIVLLNTFNQKIFQEFNPDDVKTNFVCL